MPPWNAAKAKVQLRLSVQRLRILQQKKEAQAKATRRDIATLLEKGKIETARVKVETIINEDIHVELLELLELYCELLLARFGLLDQNTREPDPGILEGVCSVIHAAPRTELKELHILRDILMHKYGREFSVAVMENRGGCVSDRVVRKLGTATPRSDLVNAYLVEIAKAYGVEWRPPVEIVIDTGGDSKESDIQPELVTAHIKLHDIESESVSGSTGTPKLPDIPPIEEARHDVKDNKVQGGGGATTSTTGSNPAPPSYQATEDDFDSLTKRFAALKKR